MKKRIVALLGMVILVLCMSMTAFAAESVQGGGNSGVEDDSKAPATGEPMMIMGAASAVVIGTAGIVASKKRR